MLLRDPGGYAMFVVISGNPFDGMTIHGPFDDGEAANDWADSNIKNDTWWVMEVEKV